ncbi:prenyltransferase/squalene oxidase repeat-containing protein [Actinophytocola oryzae]|uniref:Prenyltransferase/squalene oxidase-like repeat protein n=1 Tax=Actinophytocola oryzae TaxID=502181 RepID=A0A4R7V7N0_9PSEU|nr:prenyltransferase/squalene oxidase repeat-containing protein [Actinophytocola oryzae]TDV43726.1 prenyltransferase/squalene oxidase-like repeat protein [Actinophytocola oryzae]
MRLRLVATAVAFLSAVALVVPAGAVAAPRAAEKADAAAGWLARQMTDGDHFEVDFGGVFFPDAGLTIDGIFAFAGTKSADTNGAAAIAWLAEPANLSGYIGDGTTEAYAGATAKSSLAAQVRGLNPANFGGVDLPTRLRGLLTPSGRFSDRSAFGDFSNAFTQSLAIITLRRTSGGAPASAVSFLAGTQCPDGGFPIAFGVTPCASDTDATAMAMQALLATGRIVKAEQGLSWLASKQQANGGISAIDGNTSVAPNTNTTGLAGQAFRAGGRLGAAQKAKNFVLSLQLGCAAAVEDRGAIAYDTTGFDPNTAVRATAQAVLALGAPPLARLSSSGSVPQAPELACP